MRHHKPDPSELLSAYADDGLDPDERKAVEIYLAENPDAVAELEELRALIGKSRTMAKADVAPDWDAMRGAILEQVRVHETGKKPSYFLGSSLARPALAATFLAVAAVFVMWMFRDTGDATLPDPEAVAVLQSDARAATTEEPSVVDTDTAVLVAEVRALEDLEAVAAIALADDSAIFDEDDGMASFDEGDGTASFDEDGEFDLEELSPEELELVLSELLAG